MSILKALLWQLRIIGWVLWRINFRLWRTWWTTHRILWGAVFFFVGNAKFEDSMQPIVGFEGKNYEVFNSSIEGFEGDSYKLSDSGVSLTKEKKEELLWMELLDENRVKTGQKKYVLASLTRPPYQNKK